MSPLDFGGISFARLVVTWELRIFSCPFPSPFFRWKRSFFLFCFFYLCSLNKLGATTWQIMLLLTLQLKCKAHKAMKTQRTQVTLLLFVYNLSYTFLLIEHYVHVLFIGTHLCIIVNISCMYIMYVLNVLRCVNELILSFFPFIQC